MYFFVIYVYNYFPTESWEVEGREEVYSIKIHVSLKELYTSISTLAQKLVLTRDRTSLY